MRNVLTPECFLLRFSPNPDYAYSLQRRETNYEMGYCTLHEAYKPFFFAKSDNILLALASRTETKSAASVLIQEQGDEKEMRFQAGFKRSCQNKRSF